MNAHAAALVGFTARSAQAEARGFVQAGPPKASIMVTSSPQLLGGRRYLRAK